MLRRNAAIGVAILAFVFGGCGGKVQDSTGSSGSAESKGHHGHGDKGGDDNGGGGDDGRGDDDSQGDDCSTDDDGDCVSTATVQLISIDTTTDFVTGINLSTGFTQQYHLVFGTTNLIAANLSAYPTGPIKNAAQAYNTAVASGVQSKIVTAVSNYASLSAKANIAFTQSGGVKTLTSFQPIP
jgi:hypothetical protein